MTTYPTFTMAAIQAAPVYFDREQAQQAGFRDVPAPPMFAVVYSAGSVAPGILDPDVGINLAIQDAVATANILGQALREGRVGLDDLHAVQQRREWPAHLTQRVQIFMHKHFLERIFDATEQTAPPLPARLLEKFALLRRIPARMIGIGFRPEHVLAANK